MSRVLGLLLILLVAALTAFASSSASASALRPLPSSLIEQQTAFAGWAASQQRSYATPLAREAAFRQFVKNWARVDEMNAVAAAAGSSCRFSVFGPFGDESPEQSALLRLMEPQSQPDPIPAEHTNLLKLPRDNVQLPTSFDWREHGAVTPVYNQGSAGTCWAFSTTENIEGQYFLAGNTLTSLSVEQLVDCDSNNCGVFGGWPYRAYQWLMQTGGLESWDDYDYCSGGTNESNTCYPCMADKNKTFCGPGPSYCKRHCLASKDKLVAAVGNWTSIPGEETSLQQALVGQGPISVLIDASSLTFYHSGVWDGGLFGCSDTELDHAVLLVGYGVYNGTFENEDMWLIKNSWGSSWADYGGYFYAKRSSSNTCGLYTSATTALNVTRASTLLQ